MAPPSTIMPVGALCEGSQGGNRFSTGKSSAVPTGNPLTSSSKRMLAAQRRFPALAYRVHHNKRPQIRSAGIKLDGLGFLTLENTFEPQSPQIEDVGTSPGPVNVDSPRALIAETKHAIGAWDMPAPTWPTPGARWAMPVLMMGTIDRSTTFRASMRLGMPEKSKDGIVKYG